MPGQHRSGVGHQYSVGHGVEEPVDRQRHAQQDEAAERAREQEVDEQQGDVAAQEHPPAPDAVGEPAERNGEQQVRAGRAGREQRVLDGGELQALLQDEVDERVADPCDGEQRCRDTHPAERAVGEQPDTGAQGDPARLRERLPMIGDEQDEREQPDHREAETDHEHRVEGRRGDGDAERHHGQQRPEEGADRVHHAVYAERAALDLRGRRERDQRVARGGSQPFAEPVRTLHQAEPGDGAADEGEAEFAHRRQPVPDAGQ